MTRATDPQDLEVIPIDQDPPDLGPPRARTAHRRHVGLGVAVIAAVGLVALAVVGLVVAGHRTKPAPPAASAAQINGRLSVQGAQVVVALGDKVIARRVEYQNETGPLGLIRLAVPQSPRTPILTVQGSIVL